MPGISINGVSFPTGTTIRMRGGVYPPGTTFKIANVTITNPSISVVVNLSTAGYPRPDIACGEGFNSGVTKLYTNVSSTYESLFTDSALSNPFNGSGLWYFTDDYQGAPAAILVGPDGRVITFTPC